MANPLGVHGANLPTKKARSVVASNFLIAGLIGKFERSFNKAYAIKSPQDAQVIFGQQIDSASYAWDALNGFFTNVANIDAVLYVQSHVGYTGSAIDGAVATASLADTNGTPQNILKLDAAYQNEPEYGIGGNRTGYQVELGDRFATQCNGVGSTSDLFVVLDSVIGVFIGDIVKIVASGGTPGTSYRKITSIDEANKKVFFATSLSPASVADNDVVTVPGFKVHVYRKSTTGVVQEVDTALGSTWLTTESEVTQFYAPNVFAQSTWMKITILTTTSPAATKFPAAVSTTSFLASGAAGTTPTTAAHWSNDLTRFNDLPVRMISNCETTVDAVHKAGEAYCFAREDNPQWIPVLPENQNKAQLITIGQSWQRSNEVDVEIVAQWFQVTDPFNPTPGAPYRHVPNCGHVMGWFLQSIGVNGIHYIPAVKTNPIRGIQDIVGDQFLSDSDRTDLANAGINVAQFLTGYGFLVRNFFTPSIDAQFRFSNAIVMRNYIKISAVDSLQLSENTPNSLNLINEDGMAVRVFMLQLWNNGSNGNVTIGETFGQSQDAAGNPTKFEDHVEVRADLTNNPLTLVNAGERHIDTYFTFPTPAGIIRVGVGILVRS